MIVSSNFTKSSLKVGLDASVFISGQFLYSSLPSSKIALYIDLTLL